MRIKQLVERIEQTHHDRVLEVSKRHPLLLYINVPFCASRCAFCDWVADIPNPELLAPEALRNRYVRSLIRQIESIGPVLTELGYRVRHVYWGGGTPTRLSSTNLRDIGSAINKRFDLVECQSYTMEASPETLDEEKLSAAYDIGVRRISLGVQSFCSKVLKQAGSLHNKEKVFESVRQIRKSSINNLNVDLMVGLPGEEISDHKNSIECIKKILPEHLSLYFCRIRPKSRLARLVEYGQCKAPSAEYMIDSHSYTTRQLQAYGYTETLMGYFARGEENRCLSDAYYFGMEGEILGLGSGAFSIIGNYFLRSSSGELESYLKEPDKFDFWFKFSASAGNWIPFLHPPFWSENGLDFYKFERLLGFSFHSIRQGAVVQNFIRDYQANGAIFSENGRTIRMIPVTRTPAYIRCLVNSFRDINRRERSA